MTEDPVVTVVARGEAGGGLDTGGVAPDLTSASRLVPSGVCVCSQAWLHIA